MMEKNINRALLFDKCNSIHTFFMKHNIDVIMADKNHRVIGIYKNVSKNKIIINRSINYNLSSRNLIQMIINLNNSIRIVHRSKKKTHNTGISVRSIMRDNILLTSFITLTNKIAKNCINNMINIINYWTNII